MSREPRWGDAPSREPLSREHYRGSDSYESYLENECSKYGLGNPERSTFDSITSLGFLNFSL